MTEGVSDGFPLFRPARAELWTGDVWRLFLDIRQRRPVIPANCDMHVDFVFFQALLQTFLMAMAPVVELRGAIPFGLACGLPVPVAFLAAALGNLFPVPFILLLLRRVFAWLRRFPWLKSRVDALECRAHLKGRTMRKYRIFGLFLLVAVPLPGTGAWTGALVADVLDIRARDALPAIAGGVLAAGVIVTILSCGAASVFAAAFQG